MEGRHCFSPRCGCDPSSLESPVAEYSRSEGCSITGGYVYRGDRVPSLRGAYIFADFCSGKIWGIRFDGSSTTEHKLLIDSNLSTTSFGQDLAGNLYILSRDEGIFRLVAFE